MKKVELSKHTSRNFSSAQANTFTVGVIEVKRNRRHRKFYFRRGVFMKVRDAHIRSVFLLQLVFALGFVLTRPCAGGTIYSNLGPNNAFIVNREYETNFAFMATNFIATNGGILASITTPVFSLSSPANF